MTATLASGCDQATIYASPVVCAQQCSKVLTATILASGLVFLDGAVINVALPALGETFHAPNSTLQWLVTGYLLPLAALQLLAGALGDHFGRRRTLVAGIAVFLFASVMCAAASTVQFLLGARVLQGVGAALIVPNSLAILGSAYLFDHRARAVGIWTASSAIVAACGPVLGGWLVDVASWRYVFLLNIPIAVAALVLTVRSVRDPPNEGLSVDWRGSILVTLALGLLTAALISWSHHGTLAAPLVALLAALAFMWFAKVERRLGNSGIMPIRLFASREYLGLSVYTFLLYSSFGALFVLLPFVLMTSAAYSAAAAGAALLPLPIVTAVTSSFVSRHSGTRGPRGPLIFGSAMAAVGYLLLTRVGNGNYWTGTFPGLLLIASGMTLVIVHLTVAVLNSVDDGHTATAAGFNSAISRVGSMLAIAAGGSVMVDDAVASLRSFQVATVAGAVLVVLAALAATATLQARPPRHLVGGTGRASDNRSSSLSD